MSTRIADPTVEQHIVIDNRTWVIPAALQTIAVQNDINSETVYIDIPRYFDGIDRAGYDVYLRTVNEDGMDEPMFKQDELELGENVIVAKWTLKPPQTSFEGSFSAYIIIRKGDYQWATYEGRFSIKELTDADPIIPGNLAMYDEWLKRITEIGEKAAADAEIAADAKVSADADARQTASDRSFVEQANKEVAENAEIVQRIGDAVKAGKSPIIGSNGNWYIWNIDQYTDSGEPARGKSAYVYAQEGGYVGSEQQFSDDLANVRLPDVSSADVGKFLRVSGSGEWVAATVSNAEEASF